MKKIKGASLRNYSGFKTGGRAEMLIKIQQKKELKEIFQKIKHEFFYIIGKGYNTLISDDTVKTPVLVLEGDFKKITSTPAEITAGGGALLAEIVHKSAEIGLSGLEFLSAIPGTAGGGVMKNCGAFEKETADVIKSLEVFNTSLMRYETISARQAGFSYRKCNLDKKMIITEVKYNLKRKNKSDIIQKIKENGRKKAYTQPLDKRSCGCVFKNPPSGPPAGQLIEKAGLKGLKIGGAVVSEKHANYIYAAGGASCDDILRLIRKIKGEVRKKLSVDMEPEIDFLGCSLYPENE